ncbi:MAG: plasmid recombination protein [Lachnospiraceae bacterium]|nr:plasmid recombination protein [Lachnospiraceae bacterium]
MKRKMISFSLHLSAKRHALSTCNRVMQVHKHNLRRYQENASSIVTIRGTDDLFADVNDVYNREFAEVIDRYNEGRRRDRQIRDYMKHVSDSRSDVAVEMIVQLGDRDFWAGISEEHEMEMIDIYKDILQDIAAQVPGFKVANATIHFDESSVHMHVVGVPVAEGYKKGPEKQVAKTRVFTKESLSVLQERSREYAEQRMQRSELFSGLALKPKEAGRNFDIPREMMARFKALEHDIEEKKEELSGLDADYEQRMRELEQMSRENQERFERQVAEEKRRKKAELEEYHQEISEKERELENASRDLDGRLQTAQQIVSLQDKRPLLWSIEERKNVLKTALESSRNADKAKKAVSKNKDLRKELEASNARISELEEENRKNRMLLGSDFDRRTMQAKVEALTKENVELKKDRSVILSFLKKFNLLEKLAHFAKDIGYRFHQAFDQGDDRAR